MAPSVSSRHFLIHRSGVKKIGLLQLSLMLIIVIECILLRYRVEASPLTKNAVGNTAARKFDFIVRSERSADTLTNPNSTTQSDFNEGVLILQKLGRDIASKMANTPNKRLKYNSIHRMSFNPNDISNNEDKHSSTNLKKKHWKYVRWTNDSLRHYQNSRRLVPKHKKNMLRSKEAMPVTMQGYENSSVGESSQNFMEDIRPVVVIDVENSPGRRISNHHSRHSKPKVKNKQFRNNSDDMLRPIVFQGTLVPLDTRAARKNPIMSNANIGYPDTRDVIKHQNSYQYRNKGRRIAGIDSLNVRKVEKPIRRQSYPSHNRGMYVLRNDALMTDQDVRLQKVKGGLFHLYKNQEDILPMDTFQATNGQNEGPKFQKNKEVPMTNFRKKPYALFRAQGKNHGKTQNYPGHKKSFSFPVQPNSIVGSLNDPYAYPTKEALGDMKNMYSDDQLKETIFLHNHNNWQSKKMPVVRTKYTGGATNHKYENRETPHNQPTARVKYLQIRFPNNSVVNRKMVLSSHFSPEYSKKIYRIETEVPLSTDHPEDFDLDFVRPKHINENINNYAREMLIEGPPSKITELVPLEDSVASSTENLLQSNNSETTMDGVQMEDLENKLSKKKINIHIINSKNHDLGLNESNSSITQEKENNVAKLENKVGKLNEDNLETSSEVITHNIYREMKIPGREKKRQLAEDYSAILSNEMNNVYEPMNPAVTEVENVYDENEMTNSNDLNENIIYNDLSHRESIPYNAYEVTTDVLWLRKHSESVNPSEEISFLPLIHSDVSLHTESITSIPQVDVPRPGMANNGFSSIQQQEPLDETFDDSDDRKLVNMNDDEIDDIFEPIEEKQDFVRGQNQMLTEDFYSINDNEKYITGISKIPKANDNQGINFLEIPKELRLRGVNGNIRNENVDYADNFLPLVQTTQPEVSINSPPSESDESFPFQIESFETNLKQFLISKVEKPEKTDGNVGRNQISVYPFKNKQDSESPKMEETKVSWDHDNIPKQVETDIINRKIESENVQLQKEIPLQNANSLYHGGNRAEIKTITPKNQENFGLSDSSNDQLNADGNKQSMSGSKSTEMDLDKKYAEFQHDLDEMKPFTEYPQVEEQTLLNTPSNDLVDTDDYMYPMQKEPFVQQSVLNSKTTEYPKAVTTKYEISFLKSEIEFPSSDANLEQNSNILEHKHEDESDQYLKKDKVLPNKIIRTLEKKVEVFSK